MWPLKKKKNDKNKYEVIEINDNEIDICLSNSIEITDSNLIAKLNSMWPTTFTNSMTMISNMQLSKELVILDVPFDKLTNSKIENGAKRAMVMGRHGIERNANIRKADNSILKASNAAHSVFSLASYVVGQYNMTMIRNELKKLSGNVSELSWNNQTEDLGRIKTIFEETEKLSKFREENITSEDLRLQAALQIDELRKDASDLLNKAYFQIDRITKSEIKEKNLDDFIDNQNKLLYWKDCQQILFITIEKLAELEYAYNLGYKSLENVYSIRNKKLEECNLLTSKIKEFNEKASKKLSINREHNLVPTKDFKSHFWLFNIDLAYRKDSKNIVDNMTALEADIIPHNNIEEIDFEKDNYGIIHYNDKYYVNYKKK